MTDSKWTPADVVLTSTNASNGSGNPNVFSYSACKQDYMTMIFKEPLQLVSIYFVALLSSIVASTHLLVNAVCCVFATLVVGTGTRART